ncbi:MAG: extracellular solute-binding protein [Anaerolineales bacterium]|nr:extracellular solute-binding protein [Anaerolineales bacterium]
MPSIKTVWIGLTLLAVVLVACQPATVEVQVPATVEVQVPVTVEVEVTRQVSVEQTREVLVTPTAAPRPGEFVNDYSGDLVISVWGGTTEEWIREFVEPVFKKIYPNVTVIYDVGGMSARYTKLLAQRSNPEIDLFMSTGESLFAAIGEGLLLKVNRDNIPNMQGLYEWATPAPEYGAAYAAIAEGLCYNPDFFGDNPPTSWLDLWRPEVQGKLAVPAFGHSQMPQFVNEAAELHGGNVGNIDPGLEALAQLRPAAQTFFYTGWNAQFDAGDIVLAVDFDYYCNFMAQTGSNIRYVIPEEGAWGSIQHAAVVAGTDNQEMVEVFINLMLSPEVQASVANDLLNAPARLDVQLTPDQEELLAVSAAHQDHIKWFPENVSVQVRPGWTELLNARVAPVWGQ